MGNTASLFRDVLWWLRAFAVGPYQAALDFIAFPKFFLVVSQPVLFWMWSNHPLLLPKTFIAVSLCLLLSIWRETMPVWKCSLDGGIWIHCVWLFMNTEKFGHESHFVFVLIACDCSDPVPVDSACVVICSLFICLFREHLLSTCSGAGTVFRLRWIHVWFLLWKSFYSKKLGQKVRVSQIDPLHCIIPPCHQRDSYPFEEIQQAFTKSNKKPPVFPRQWPYCDV